MFGTMPSLSIFFSPGVNDFEQSSKYDYFDDDDDAFDPW
jgi:hypothetical protein